jgi:uncharacterized protein YegL
MSHLRRLPVYLVIDCSESMAGPAFEAVQNGLDTLLSDLRTDPNAIETVFICVITFHAKAKIAVPLTDVPSFIRPKLVLGSGTSLGTALELLLQRMNQEVIVQTADRKGDWKPLVFILTDGNPTDTWFNIADIFLKTVSGRKANVVALACGPDVDTGTLRRITPNVLSFKDHERPQFADFFKWISQSVQTTSAKFLSGAESGVTLPDLPSSLEMAPEGLQLPQEQFVFLLAKCQQHGGLQILRHTRIPREVVIELRETRNIQLPLDRPLYIGAVSHPIEDFDLEGSRAGLRFSVASDQLLAPPACAGCGAKSWGHCGECEGIFCVPKQSQSQTCPWCGDTGSYDSDRGAFEIGRGLG